MRHGQSLLSTFQKPAVLQKGESCAMVTTMSCNQQSPLPPQTPAARLFVGSFCQVNFHPHQCPDLSCHVATPGVASLQRRSWDCPSASRTKGLVDMLLWWLQAFMEETIPERAQRKWDVAMIYFPALTIVILVTFNFSTMIHGWKIISINIWHVN